MEENENIGCAYVLWILLIGIALVCFEWWTVMKLWNSVAVSIFSVEEINFGQSAGLTVLCNLLFSGVSNTLLSFTTRKRD